MCLSPEVDIVAGVAITVVAVDAAAHAGHRRLLPLGLLPAVFAVHTFSSALVWWGSDGTVPEWVGDAATSFFIFIAFVLLPVYVPISVVLLEPKGWRRDALLLLGGAGALAGMQFLVGIASGRASAEACSYYINFTVTGISNVAGVLYVLATCGALLLSRQRPLFWWGVVNVAAVAFLVVWEQNSLPSLWCFWAACTSVFVAWYLRRLERSRAAGGAWPWEEPVSRSATGPSPPPDLPVARR